MYFEKRKSGIHETNQLFQNISASCMEKAYKDIDTEECRKMLHLDVGKLEKYAEEKEWTFEKNGKKISFLPSEKNKSEMEMEVPSKELAAMAITYAKEMEKIV